MNYSSYIFSLQLLAPLHQFPYELEEVLLSAAHNRQYTELSNTIEQLLSYARGSKPGQLLSDKNRIIEVGSVLSRLLIEQGASIDLLAQFHSIFDDVLSVYRTRSEIQELLRRMGDFVLSHIMQIQTVSESHSAVCRARGYIARHFTNHITLEEISYYVNLNPSYLSSIFSPCCGYTYKEFLTGIRIEKSRQLLATTNFDIIDVAIAAGFEDQSYFTKVFRKYTGLTPKKFRLSNR